MVVAKDGLIGFISKDFEPFGKRAVPCGFIAKCPVDFGENARTDSDDETS